MDKKEITKQIEVFYNGRTYIVTNPGEIIYDSVTSKRKIPKLRIVRILDQLNGLSEVGTKRKKYLLEKYNLTELDYYIIVVLEGDSSKLPECSYIDPKIKEKCNNKKKFRSLIPTKQNSDFFYDGCSDHVANVAAQIKQREAYKKGITGLQKADRRSKIWRYRLREHALKQIKEGKSILSANYIEINGIKRSKHQMTVSDYNETASQLNLTKEDLSIIENLILVDKYMFLNKGLSDDSCIYYLTEFRERKDVFKLGVTSNPDYRSRSKYHGLTYENFTIMFTSTREIIAEIEYKIKMKFKDYICLGNEGFSISIKDDIIKCIKEIIDSINSPI